jgi:hypothetical protein
MPVIFVWNAFGLDPQEEALGLSPTHTPSAVKKGNASFYALRPRHREHGLGDRLREAVLSMPELGSMSAGDVLIIFPEAQASPADLTLISVDVLFAAEQRTREVRERLAQKLKDAAMKFYTDVGVAERYKVEVAVRRFDAQADVYL